MTSWFLARSLLATVDECRRAASFARLTLARFAVAGGALDQRGLTIGGMLFARGGDVSMEGFDVQVPDGVDDRIARYGTARFYACMECLRMMLVCRENDQDTANLSHPHMEELELRIIDLMNIYTDGSGNFAGPQQA